MFRLALFILLPMIMPYALAELYVSVYEILKTPALT